MNVLASRKVDMADLTSAKMTALAGLDPAFAPASSGGDTFANSGGAILLIQNGDSASHTVTITSYAQAVPGLVVNDIDIVVPAGELRVVKGFGSKTTKNEENKVELTYDAVTGLEVAVIE
jgi:hypothetical protein